MQIEGASKIIESIDQTIGKDGLDNKKLIPKLKELRDRIIDSQNKLTKLKN